MAERALSEIVSSRSRLRIASLLSVRPRTLAELAQLTGMSVQGVLKHLSKLKELGILEEAPFAAVGARKVYSLKGFDVGDFSSEGLTVVKMSRRATAKPEEKRPLRELEYISEDSLLLRRRIRNQSRRLGRMIDELFENEAALRATLGSLKLTDEERIILQTVFAEETLEDARKSLGYLGLGDAKAVDDVLKKVGRAR